MAKTTNDALKEHAIKLEQENAYLKKQVELLNQKAQAVEYFKNENTKLNKIISTLIDKDETIARLSKSNENLYNTVLKQNETNAKLEARLKAVESQLQELQTPTKEA